MIETRYLQNIVIFVKISYSPCYFVSFSSIFTRGVFSDSFLSTTILVRLLQTPDFLGMLMSTLRSLLFYKLFQKDCQALIFLFLNKIYLNKFWCKICQPNLGHVAMATILSKQLQRKNLCKGDMWHIYGVKFRKIFSLSLFTDYLQQ